MKKIIVLIIVFSVIISSSGNIFAEEVVYSSDTVKKEYDLEEENLDKKTLKKILKGSEMKQLEAEIEESERENQKTEKENEQISKNADTENTADIETDKDLNISETTEENVAALSKMLQEYTLDTETQNDEYKENEIEDDYEEDDDDYGNVFNDLNVYNSSNLKGKILKYSDVAADSSIEVSSKTVIPDDNDLGTYYMSGAIIEKSQKPDYDLNIPTTTALGIAGEKVLDKLNIDKSKEPVQKDIKFDPAKGVTISSTTKQDKKKSKKLPFDSQLFLSGRKMIGVNYSGTIYDNEKSGKRANSGDFSMEQELQMKIKGKVGDRLELNVDFDDTQEDKKDISIVYKGKGEEFVQEAAFGDISVNLPSTEFSGYSKELFGAKVDTKYKGLKTNAFFSKTKGFSESKQFKGSSKTEKKTIADTSYIKLKYYSILKPGVTKTIKNDTAKVYLDKIKTTVSDYIVISTSTDLKYLKDTSKIYNGNFVKLVAGTDYTIDYTTGIITFKTFLSSQYVVAIDYQYSDGTWLSDDTSGNPLIIKDTNNTEALSTEVHTFYSLGNYQITKYNGRDNFILEVRDLNDTVPAEIDNKEGIPSTKPVPKFPNIEGYDANITVDYDNGVFNLNPVTGKPLHDELYSSNTHRYNFVTQYEYKVKIFNLRANIVPLSEKVIANGRTLKINDDYVMDYDVGILTILKEDLISDNVTINVSYDYSPIAGSAAGSTLVGLRSQYDFNRNAALGGSFIYEFAAEDTKLPDIYSAPSSTFVGEIDGKVKDVKISDKLSFSASGEYATSKYIQNTVGKAIIESMESAKLEDSLILLEDNWFYSSVPKDYSSATYDTNAVKWNNYDIEKREIDKNLEIVSGEKQQVMDINYNLLSCDYVSIGQIISPSGYDFSKKLYLEIWIKANLSQVNITLDFASSIDEDSDQNGTLDTEDKNGDGIISPWEDIGRDFTNKTTSYGITKIGAGNGRLDTEDLNGNNILDKYETNLSSFTIDGTTYGDSTKTGWQRVQIPLDISTDADKEKWKNIRVARLTVKNVVPGTGYSGTLTVGKISVVGNKWTKETSSAFSDCEIFSIGRDDYRYQSLITNSYYRSLYDIDSSAVRDEQALAITYEATASNDFFAKATYSSGFDISSYGKYKFFLYVSTGTAVGTSSQSNFIMRVGGDEKNYYQYSIPISSDLVGQWTVLSVDQTGYGATARWETKDSNVTITTVGNPSLQKIAFIETGVQTTGADKGEIWINEIHVTDAKSKDGSAWKADLNVKWAGTNKVGEITVDMHRKSIDKDFQTFAPGTYDRDLLEDYAKISFKGVKLSKDVDLLPINASLTKTRTFTPMALQNTSDQVSVLDQGKVVSYNGTVNTILAGGKDLPKITLEYNRFIQDTENIERLEDKETLSANMVYLNPIDFDLLPTSVVGDYKVSNSQYKVYPTEHIEDTNAFLDIDTMRKYMDVNDFLTLEKTETYSLKTPFSFFDKVIFSPAYVITRVNEKNKEYFVNQEISYDKSLNQDVGASLNFQVAKWFQPNVLYNIKTTETYDLNYSTNTTNIIYPGQKKYIERVGVTEITWNLQAKDIVQTKYLNSLTFTTSYRMQDSDAYSNVEKNFSSVGLSMEKLWIRGNHLKEILPVYSTSSYTVRKVLQRDDRRIIGRYNPFEAFDLKGKWMPIKTMSMSFGFTEGDEDSYDVGTIKNSYTRTWPDILIGMSRFEKVFGKSWMSDTQLNLKYNNKTNAVEGFSFGESRMFGGDYKFKFYKKYDILLSADITNSHEIDTEKNITTSKGQILNWALQTATNVKQWRFSVRYDNQQSWTKNSVGKLATQIFSNMITLQATSDLVFPTGIKLPIVGVIPLKNRLIFDSSAFYNTRGSAVNVEADNFQNFGFKISADYEVSKNFRFTFGSNLSRYLFTFVPEENYTVIELISKLTIQF